MVRSVNFPVEHALKIGNEGFFYNKVMVIVNEQIHQMNRIMKANLLKKTETVSKEILNLSSKNLAFENISALEPSTIVGEL